MKKIISTSNAPAAIGPYSQAVVLNDMVYTSGVIPIDPVNGTVVNGDIKVQTKRVLQSLEALLKDSGSDLGKVVKTTVFIKNMEDFPLVNEVYASFFTDNFPARSCVEVARLPKDVLIEVEAVAYI
ncbi:2-iminobutanoate/2-iminopropanoate deaminase [Anaerocolumna jejuensis DSM 15929]|uniref:2-iminobutanoate/2-iminopropanoate deaminase n=1 Tax=Anaerocolumna jejuensis DSM 15929 TaxID=1121322 RepID=A0A1M7C2D3_9FIRM|nr:RidA family protein [Anaerocolumna jejuensis]SHL61323.1 2-iminobutanoate/2-iminopropanoate deaminase [Anaerocolumna jejuensis DSM 15929]